MRFEQIGCIVENLVIISTIDYKNEGVGKHKAEKSYRAEKKR